MSYYFVTDPEIVRAVITRDAGRTRDLLAAGEDPNGGRTSGPFRTPLLHFALENRSLEIVRLLLAAGADPNSTQAPGDHTALIGAAAYAEPEIVRELLKAGADVNSRSEGGETPLSTAILPSGLACAQPLPPWRVETARVLIDGGADVGAAQGALGTSPLCLAAASGSQELVDLLLEAGADPSRGDTNGQTPAFYAAWHGYTDLARKLAAREASAESLVAAVKGGEPEAVRLHLRRGTAASEEGKGKLPAVTWACLLHHTEILHELLRDGANPNQRVPVPNTPFRATESLLGRACRLGQERLALTLLEGGAKAETKDSEGQTPLMRAAARGNMVTVRALLKAGAPSRGALTAAVDGGCDDVALELARSGAGVRDPRALTRAAAAGLDDVVRALIDRGADVNADKGAALQAAASASHPHVVEVLLTAGAKPNTPQKQAGPTALVAAAQVGCTKAVESLVRAGASLEAKAENRTALSWAAAAGHGETVQKLLQMGAKVPAKGKLMSLIAAGDQEAAIHALREGEDPDAKTADGATALEWAAALGYVAVVETLLDKGAGPTPDALLGACRAGRLPVIRFLLERGGKNDPRLGVPIALRDAAQRLDVAAVRALLAAGAEPADQALSEAVAQSKCIRPGTKALEVVQALLEAGADPGAALEIAGDASIAVREQLRRARARR